jgi:hypothetical protein
MTDDDLNEFAAIVLANGKELYDQGDKTQILECLHFCLAHKVPTPPWLEQAFENAYWAKVGHKIKSWDEVFGRPLKKGIRPARERRNKLIKQKIYWRVLELHNCGAGEPIDKKLFEAVGKEFGVGGTVAAELYYEVKKRGPMTADEIEDFEDGDRLSKIAPFENIKGSSVTVRFSRKETF